MGQITQKVVLHGHELAVTDHGEGTAIVLVHGLMSTRHTWDAQIDRLALDHRVIAPDLFGHGDSTKPVGDYSLGAHAAALRDLLDAIDVRSATIVGHSLGGGIAMQFAYLFPDRVERIALISSGGLGRELNLLLRAATLPGSELVLPLLASGWLHQVGDGALRLWGRAGLPSLSPSSAAGWNSLASLSDGETRRAFLATSRSIIDIGGQTVSAQHRMSMLTSRPVLLMWGANDRMIPASHLDSAREALPHSQVEIMERSGHFPHLDEPDRFATVLSKFATDP